MHQTESAFVGPVKAGIAGTVAGQLNVYCAHEVYVNQVLTTPYVILKASNPQQFGYDSGIYEHDLEVAILTQADDELTAATLNDIHHQRVEIIRDIMENFTALRLALNAPAAPNPDKRTVTGGYTFSAIKYTGETQEFEERKMATLLKYYVCAAPYDNI